MQLDQDITSPELGYAVVQSLLQKTKDFTAIVCFNDIAALGAIRAIGEAGLRTPEDISIVGFDDIRVAVFARPSITTIRQPLGDGRAGCESATRAFAQWPVGSCRVGRRTATDCARVHCQSTHPRHLALPAF